MFSIKKQLFLSLLIIFVLLPVIALHAQSPATNSIKINAIAGLQFNVVRFQVRPGSKVKIVVMNKDDMSHNLVITQPGARVEVVNAAINLGDKGVTMNYVPKTSKVLWATKLLAPEEVASLVFTAPKKEGVYPYVCTYPGHGFVMFGAMYVTNGSMPDLSKDPNIPPARNNVAETTGNNNMHQHYEVQKANHPYKEVPPLLYRIFVQDASPAAIAVNLPQKISYCWDAGTCRLRYAWEGDFLDNSEVWKGHHDAYAKILGTVFYRDKTKFPLCLDKPGNIPMVAFKGYRLVNRYPEFNYTIDGVDVHELLKEKADGTGLIREFTIGKTDRNIWFVSDVNDGVTYQTSVGKIVEGKLKLSPGQAHHLTIIMTKK